MKSTAEVPPQLKKSPPVGAAVAARFISPNNPLTRNAANIGDMYS